MVYCNGIGELIIINHTTQLILVPVALSPGPLFFNSDNNGLVTKLHDVCYLVKDNAFIFHFSPGLIQFLLQKTFIRSSNSVYFIGATGPLYGYKSRVFKDNCHIYIKFTVVSSPC